MPPVPRMANSGARKHAHPAGRAPSNAGSDYGGGDTFRYKLRLPVPTHKPGRANSCVVRVHRHITFNPHTVNVHISRSLSGIDMHGLDAFDDYDSNFGDSQSARAPSVASGRESPRLEGMPRCVLVAHLAVMWCMVCIW